jgi:hypothetical protein
MLSRGEAKSVIRDASVFAARDYSVWRLAQECRPVSKDFNSLQCACPRSKEVQHSLALNDVFLLTWTLRALIIRHLDYMPVIRLSQKAGSSTHGSSSCLSLCPEAPALGCFAHAEMFRLMLAHRREASVL